MKDGGAAFPVCSKCGNAAILKQGHQWLCEKHYRFSSMRTRAKRDGKYVPSYEELESMVPGNMTCPSCKRVMNWRQRDGAATVITLQHNRDGTIQFLCLSCNTRHASREGDSFYNENPQMEKRCPICGLVKPLGLFSTDNGKRWKNKKTLCTECSSKSHKEWVNKNRMDHNAKRRAYYHRRIAAGNPIPR
jgi:hypothetical protein